ncbi:hypothetical protein A9965_018960 [Vibrio cholerae O1 biovar El Tor]|nr:hypothetical protein A9965_018960 [Vibrio cholerae O1 biovar El Tor]
MKLWVINMKSRFVVLVPLILKG